LPAGRAVTNVSSVIELGSGLHRWDAEANQWVDTDNTIEILPNGSGAVSHRGAHQVAFAANLNTRGAITLGTPDGKRLVSHVLGLAWFDAATGRSEMFAHVQDSIGELHGTDTVLYPDAFAEVNAAVRYTNRKGGFEQDIILYENVSPPAGFALDTTRLEVWTEFIEAPAATLTQKGRSGMTDDTLDWGTMQTGPGRAFLLGEELRSARATVAKRWVISTENRTFLVEAVRYQFAKRDLEQLPPRQAAINKAGNAVGALAKAVQGFNGERPFPPAPAARTQKSTDKFRTAAVPSSPMNGKGAGEQVAQAVTPINSEPTTRTTKSALGFVIDYEIVGSITNNFTFHCGTTYYVSNTVNFSGTTTFEGCSVVKFAKTNTAQLTFNGPVEWRTWSYRPAIFTAKDDDTVGEAISGSTGAPSGYYGGQYLAFNSDLGTPQDLRISYATIGIGSTAYQPLVRHAQFLHCSNSLSMGLWATALLTLENVLFYDVSAVYAGQCQLAGTHLSVRQCGKFFNGSVSPNPTITLRNSIFVRMTNWGNVSSNLTACFEGTDDSIFQTVGAAAHYLAASSTNRNAGSSLGISPTLLADLAKRTTFPPIILTGNVTTNFTFTARAQRDSDIPDLGFHYAPLDYAIGGLVATNVNLVVQPGTALATYPTPAAWALVVAGQSQFLCEGSPTNLNWIARYNTVQEQANTNWIGTEDTIATGTASGAGPVLIRCRFTEWSTFGLDTIHLHGGIEHPGAIQLIDSQIHGGWVISARPSILLTNSLFCGSWLDLNDQQGAYTPGHSSRNSLFHRSTVDLAQQAADTWTWKDNLFSQSVVEDFSSFYITADYNGYTTNTFQIAGGAAHDVLLATSNLNFQIGPLGAFYLPTNGPATNLFDTGSTYATNVGLYHFTTITNQAKEAGTMVDIGLHYVVLNSSGLAMDSDGDGLPDYFEDKNGNGSQDGSESDWNNRDSDGDGITDFVEWLLGGNPLVASGTDTNGLIRLQVYSPLR